MIKENNKGTARIEKYCLKKSNSDSEYRECTDCQGKELYECEHQDVWFIDEVGGARSDGLGWNPRGYFCGECSEETCKGCGYIDK